MSSLALSNFVNCYYQYRDILSLEHVKTVLLVGVGTGLEPMVIRWAGFDVVTADIDETLQPDHVLSVDDLSMFEQAQFDVAIASHVLEHLPWSRFEVALAHLARVARWSIIYLPVGGAVWSVKWFSTAPTLSSGSSVNIASPFRSVSEEQPLFMDSNHYWEIGRPGTNLRRVRNELSRHFEIRKEYRNVDWPLSHNFICRSRVSPARRELD